LALTREGTDVDLSQAVATLSPMPIQELVLAGRWQEEDIFALGQLLSDSLYLLIAQNVKLGQLTSRVTSRMPNLAMLALSGNSLTSLDPDALAPLSKLQSLDLSFNDIRELDADGKLKLTPGLEGLGNEGKEAEGWGGKACEDGGKGRLTGLTVVEAKRG
jgi:Leucine-rich repeat (LRR) protein